MTKHWERKNSGLFEFLPFKEPSTSKVEAKHMKKKRNVIFLHNNSLAL
jgi:hypothetical protein